MKKDNKIIIIGIIAIVAAISLIITMLIISNKNNKEQKDMPYTIYDTWYAKSLKTITKDTTVTEISITVHTERLPYEQP